jgi:DNA mismatch endonuclease, patch repair protein
MGNRLGHLYPGGPYGRSRRLGRCRKAAEHLGKRATWWKPWSDTIARGTERQSNQDGAGTLRLKKTDPYPHPTSAAVTAVMKGNRRVNTKPETAVRSLLHRMGIRFRKDHPIQAGDVRVRPDIVFTRHRVAVFVDGCYWHSCPEHGRSPKSNTFYWGPKLERNRQRDLEVDRALKAHGWQVLRFWEHEDPEEVASFIEQCLSTQRN